MEDSDGEDSVESPELPVESMAELLQRPLVAMLLLCFLTGVSSIPDPKLREALIQLEQSMQTGGKIKLNSAEEQLDEKLSKLKQAEMEKPDFPPAMHFFKARDLIKASPVFNILQKMPKGGALHLHDFAIVDVEWLVKNVTYRPLCYMCFTDNKSLRFIFSFQWPKPLPQCSAWTLLENLRNKTANTTDLDNSIMNSLRLFTDQDPEVLYPSQDVIWERFEQNFQAVWGLATCVPVFKDYIYRAFSLFHSDNVMYLEVRGLLPELYELDGSTHDKSYTLKAYQDVTKQFMADHPDFFGVKIISSIQRAVNVTRMTEAVKWTIKMQEDFPDFLAGFDLVGREDSGRPLWYFRDALSLPEQSGVRLPFFFHAGETNLEGAEVDQNLMDALLFNTSRIGHGFALPRHPVAKDLSRRKGVAVEVCPISNQVMKLVKDLRNHPAATLMLENHPLVVSSDDPAIFGAVGLSYDFYEAFVGFGGLKSNLGTLKQLAVNSIKYSSLSPKQQEKALALWITKWNTFVSENAF